MSEKTSVTNHAPKAIDTLIGAGMRIEGDIACTGVLRVQGEILGNVSCQENPKATLMVDGAGKVSGTVRASHVVVRGGISGPVRSLQSIEVHQGGSITGDVSYKEIAVHAGGVVDGLLRPERLPEAAAAAPESRAKAPESMTSAAIAEVNGAPARFGGARGIALVALVAALVGAVVWIDRNPEVLGRRGDGAAPKPDAAAKAPGTDTLGESAAPPARVAASADAPVPPAEKNAVPIAIAPAATPPDAASPAAAEPAGKGDDNVVAVRGTNPSRPSGVFLLISNEPSVLYRKINGEPGDGARVTVPAGEKVSVAIARDELIRVAQGRDVMIFYQGKKVSRDVIDSGSWISFVPK